MISEKDLSNIIGQPEGEELEYKAVLPPARTMGQLISSFANTKGGLIVLGVAEKGSGRNEAIGLSEDFQANSIVHKAIDLLNPKPSIEYYYSKHGSKRIYVIQIAKSDAEILIEGKAFIRHGSTTVLKHPPIKIIKKDVYLKIDALGKKLIVSPKTEALSKFLDHYQSVLNILSDSKSLLYPKSFAEPTNNPEGKILMRILFSSCADNFETYLSDLLYEIYLAKPESLKSEETVTIKEVLDCNDLQEFINYFAKKKLSKLKRGSVTAFLSENKQIEKLNAIDSTEQKEIEKLLQIRHLYAHNSGIVDEKFLKYFPAYRLNDTHELSLDTMLAYLEYFVVIVSQIDKAAMQKFNLANAV